MTHRPTVHVAAGGKGTRLQGMVERGFGPAIPKHLLTTGSGETLLGRIVRQIHSIGYAAIHTRYDNVDAIGHSHDIDMSAQVMIDRHSTGPLGPLIREVQRTHERTFSCAGDFWANFSWGNFLDFHDQQDTPVSIMVARSVPTFEGARFEVGDDGVVTGWGRVDQTTPEDLINIGAYIIDPEKLVLRKLRELGERHKEDPFNTTMIEGGLMSAFVLQELAYNVNTPQVYIALVQHTTEHQ